MLPVGTQIDEYRILAPLGTGGFGITYLAEDETLQVKVAIKEFIPGDLASHHGVEVVPDESSRKQFHRFLDAFIKESRCAAKIRHKNVVQVMRCFPRNGTAYMVMVYEEGVSLDEWLRTLGHRPTMEEIKAVVRPVLDGLTAVHAVGLIHRDLKPSNIFLRDNNEPVILDFGSARPADAERFTRVLTAGYAPIEQYEEDGAQGPWTDVYSMAAVIYRMVTGTKPLAALNRLALDRLVPAGEACRESYPESFLAAIDWALTVMPEKRPRNVEEWSAALWAKSTSAEVKGHAVRRTRPDELDWQWALASESEPGYLSYLKMHPDGIHAGEARDALLKLRGTPSAVAGLRGADDTENFADDPDADEVMEEEAGGGGFGPTPRPRLDPAPGHAAAHAAGADAEDHPVWDRFELVRPSLSLAGLLLAAALLLTPLLNLFMRSLLRGVQLSGIFYALLGSWAGCAIFAVFSHEMNAWSRIVWSGAAALFGTLFTIMVFLR